MKQSSDLRSFLEFLSTVKTPAPQTKSNASNYYIHVFPIHCIKTVTGTNDRTNDMLHALPLCSFSNVKIKVPEFKTAY